jgi:lipopolysaccharide export system permease protein
MKTLSRYIIKEHLTPFIMALLVLLFILLANFLLRSMDRFMGKGLDFSLIMEYVFLNLAWILALAVPMAILVATLMAFGRLSSDNEIAAMRSVSVSYFMLMTPAMLLGCIIAGLMMYFNNQILPEMNHRARMLSSDISRKRPDLDFDVGYFIDAIPQYNFLLGSRDGEVFQDITIFSSKEARKQQTIIASSGTISAVDDGVVLHLLDGVIHEYTGNEQNEYRQIYFEKYQVVIPVDNMVMSRRDSKIRGDREMTFAMIKDKIKSFEVKIINTHNRIRNRLINEAEKLNITPEIDSLTAINPIITTQALSYYELVIADSIKKVKGGSIARVERRLKNLSRGIESDFSLINSYKNSINKYLVELHKKFSIPFASIIFILIGAPLGMMARKGGFAVSMAFSLGFFIIYWMFLIGGEEFADRGLLSPVLSMWLPNIVLGIFGILICYWQSLEQRTINFDLINVFKINNGK